MKQISAPDRRSGDDLKPSASVPRFAGSRERIITRGVHDPLMRRPWLLVLYGAAAAGGVRAGDRLRRTFDRPLAGGVGGHPGAGRILDQPEPAAKPRPESTLIDDLLVQARLAEHFERLERIEVDPEPLQVCEIAVWRGYFTWQFYATSRSPLESSYSSSLFRARGRSAPERTGAALRGHAALVERLTADGWEPDGCGEHWFSKRFRRALLLAPELQLVPGGHRRELE
jgi:hypothetical protein